MRKFLSAPMELHLHRWAGIYPHNQMHLQSIPLPLSAVNNHHPNIPAHQHRRAVIKTRPIFILTPSSILVHTFIPISSHFLLLFSHFWQHFHSQEWLYIVYYGLTEVGELALCYAVCNVASPFLPPPCSLRDAQRLDVVGYCVVDPPTATLLI